MATSRRSAGKLLEQRGEQGAGLAAREAAEDRLGAQLARHPRDPYALAAGVQVDVVALAAAGARS